MKHITTFLLCALLALPAPALATLGATSLSASNLTLTSGTSNSARVEVGSGADTAGLNSGASNSDICIWAGASHANRTSAPLRITCGGSITATAGTFSGSLTGASGTFGGNVTLDSNGITIAAGTGATNRVKWSDGGHILSNSGTLLVAGPSAIDLIPSSNGLRVTPGGLYPLGGADLGSGSARFVQGYLQQANLSSQFPLVFEHASFQSGNQYLCVDSAGRVFASSTFC